MIASVIEDSPEIVEGVTQCAAAGVFDPDRGQRVVEVFPQRCLADGPVLQPASPLEQQRHRRVVDALVLVVGHHQRHVRPGAADPAHDRGQHVGQLGRYHQEPFLIGLGRGDLQQRDQFAGARQPVLDQAVVGELCQLLDPYAGETQHFNGRPGPEPAVLFEGEVTAFAGAGVLGPGPAGRLGFHRRPAQRLPAGGEHRARTGALGGLQPVSGGVAFAADPGGQGGQHRQPLPGPLVHPRLAPRPVLFVGHLAGADRAAHRPRHPPGVVIGPLGDVEIHRPDRGQHVAAVQAGGHRGDGCPIGSAGRSGLGHDALFPRGGDVAGEF
jgi:hypothetical protein